MSVEVCSLDSGDFIELPEVFTQPAIPVNRENILCEEDLNEWPYLQAVQLKSIRADISLLIGVNVPKATELLKVINSQDTGPYAVLTHLGWTVNGPLGISSPVDQHGRPQIVSNRISVARLEELLIQQYNQDFSELAYQEKAEHSFQDKRFLEVIIRKKKVIMCYDCHSAEMTSICLIIRKWRNKELFKKGHAEMVPGEQLLQSDGILWYIPHHGVFHKQKGSIRVVFNCTSSFQDTSLNSELLQGPDLTNTLLGVLLRFRQESVAVMGTLRECSNK